MPSQSPRSPEERPSSTDHEVNSLEPGTATESRRGHKKSRLGCGNCKRRKIKCDESRPECSRCQAFGVSCDYMPNNTCLTTLMSSTRATDSTRRRGRPRRNWPVPVHEVDATHPSPVVPDLDPTTVGMYIPDLPLNDMNHSFEELEAYLHYSSCAHDIMGSHAATWQQCTVDLTQQYPFLYNAIISITAFHLASATSGCSTEASSYIALANLHLSTALKDATDLLPQLDVDGYQPIYLVSIITCFASLARGPSVGDFLVIGPGGKAPWLSMLRAVRSVLQTDASRGASSTEYVCTSVNAIGLSERPLPAVKSNASVGELRNWDWDSSFTRMMNRSGAKDDLEAMAKYRSELRMTHACHYLARRRDRGAKDNGSRFMIIIGWVYRLSDVFIAGLEMKDKAALLILGHFAPVLSRLEGEYWWLKGWSAHLLGQINGVMEPGRGSI